jgi:hypothetical protein
MRQLLMGEFDRNHHPLISSIYYDIESLQCFYLKYLDTRELLFTLASNLESVFSFFDTKKYKKFFHDKFLIDESKKEELRTLRNKHGRTIFEIIDSKANNSRWIKKRHQNAKEFYELLQEIASEDGNDIK